MEARRSRCISDLVIIERLSHEQKAGYSKNCVRRVRKRSGAGQDADAKKFQNIWYLKYDNTYLEALCEVVAQELFRLLIPGHPKTRLVEGNNHNPRYVMSKEVEGYQSLHIVPPTDLILNLAKGKYYGLGEIMIVSMFVNEADLKLANLCLDATKRILKLDGDCCFAELIGIKHRSDVTADDLASLFKLKHYSPTNWLEDLALFGERIESAPEFRQEVNRALLRICLLPEMILQRFVEKYAQEKDQAFLLANELFKRRKMLLNAAVKQPYFRQYFLSPQAETDAHQFAERLKTFQPFGKATLMEVDAEVDQRVMRLLTDLRRQGEDINWEQTWMGSCQKTVSSLWAYIPANPFRSMKSQEWLSIQAQQEDRARNAQGC